MSTNAPRSSGASGDGPSGPRNRALTALGAALSIACLVALGLWAVRQEAPTLPSGPVPLAELGAAIAFYLAGCAVRAERWHELLRYNGAQPRRADSYGLLAVGQFGNNVLPARAGDALRVVLLTPRARTDARTVIGTIVAERVLDVVVLVGLFVVLAYGVLGGVDVPSTSRLAFAALLVAGLLAAAGAAAWILHRRGRLRRVLAFIAPMAEATRRLRSNHGMRLLGITFAVWALEWVAWWLTARAVGIDLALLEIGYLMGLASIFALVPSGPGYVGTFDAAIVFGVRAVGRTGAQALSYLLLLRFVVTVPITLIGLVVLVFGYGGVGRVRALVRA
ncbi:MAG: lysylphosphatidylglycerol synthase transmembrane domain-containing protein [Solirubrobacteraceae bacterium]|nr:lysylphosphatidylglycerol synthase transmembrane domain-containing protein [Solirubrobacteraceae bacterium]